MVVHQIIMSSQRNRGYSRGTARVHYGHSGRGGVGEGISVVVIVYVVVVEELLLVVVVVIVAVVPVVVEVMVVVVV